MNAVAFRSEGHPFGCSVASGMLLPEEGTHSGLQDRLHRKDADGLWIWNGRPDTQQILRALRSGKPIASVEGAQLLVLHPKHEERWDKCPAEVYWGAVEALYASDPEMPELGEILGFLQVARKPKGELKGRREYEEVQAAISALGSTPRDTRSFRELLGLDQDQVDTFVRCGGIPQALWAQMSPLLASGGLPAPTILGAIRLAAPRERAAVLEASTMLGLPSLLC